MSNRIALLMGSGRYPEEPQLSALAGPANDVQHLAGVLANAEIGGFDVRTFVDVEHYKLLPVVESILRNAQKDDLILLYYSGHGKQDLRGQLYLATVNTKLDTLQSTSLSLPQVKSLIDSSRSNRIILVLDCCFSGAAAKAFVRSAVDDQLKLAQEEGAAGLHILTSATSIQTSLEREHEEGGVVLGEFTRCIVEGIKSGEADLDNDEKITVTDLQRYLHGRVRGQKPRYWGLEASGDLVIARSPVLKPAPLPNELQKTIEDRIPWVREGAVRELGRLLYGEHKGLVLAAEAELKSISERDDSNQVRTAAEEVLKTYANERTEGAERLARERREREERERAAREEAERRARDEAARRQREQLEQLARDEAERQKGERQARKKAEAERKAREEAARLERERRERQAREEAERQAQERQSREKIEPTKASPPALAHPQASSFSSVAEVTMTIIRTLLTWVLIPLVFLPIVGLWFIGKVLLGYEDTIHLPRAVGATVGSSLLIFVILKIIIGANNKKIGP